MFSQIFCIISNTSRWVDSFRGFGFCWRCFFYYVKCKFFDICCLFVFENCVGKIQSKLIYRLDRLKREELSLFWDASWKNYDLHCRIKTPEIGWSISYNSVNQFWLNLSHQNSKNKSTSNVKKFHILWNIFSHFNISHNRRNTR